MTTSPRTRGKSRRKGLESCVRWQPGTPLLQGMTARAESFLLKLLAKAFSGRDFPAARSDAEQPEVFTGRVTSASPHHLPARLHLPAGCKVAWDHAPSGADRAITSKYREDIRRAPTPFLPRHYLHLPCHPSWHREVGRSTVWEMSLPSEWE